MTTAGMEPADFESAYRLLAGGDPLGEQLRSRLASVATRASAPPAAIYVAQSRSTKPRSGLPDLDDAASCFRQLEAEPPRRLLVVSSTQVFEPSHRHLAMTPDACLPRLGGGGSGGNRVAAVWRRLEDLAKAWASEHGVPLTVLRAAPLAVHGGRDPWSRLFRRRVAFTYPGYDPTLQVLSVADLAEALRRLLGRARAPAVGEPEILHLIPASNVPLRKALRHAGVLRVPVPRWIQSLLRPAIPGAVSLHQQDFLRHGFSVSEVPSDVACVGERTSAEAVREVRTGADAANEPRHFDEYGLDKDYVRRLGATLFRFLHDVWWRVDVRGLDEYLPAEGPVVLVGIHRGFQPWDGVMAMQEIARRTGRHVRFLTHPTLIKFPFLAPYMLKLGAVPPAVESADEILDCGQVLAIFPEGIRGAFLEYGPNVYRPLRFRPDFVRFALRHRAPIVPFVTIGAAEIYPILKNFRWSWWQRHAEWPYLPLTPTLGTIPLPSKWHTRYLPPIHLDHPPEAAADVKLVRRLSDEVRADMAKALDDLVRRRRRIFWGDLAPDSALPKDSKQGSMPRSNQETR